MRNVVLFALVLLFGLVSQSYAQSTAECDGVLVPNTESVKTDYRLAQNFMYVNAESEYERLKKLDKDARGADGSFLAFSAEYNESKSSEEFREKVRQRIKRENQT